MKKKTWMTPTYIMFKPKGHFTHETEGPRPLYFKPSHWWKKRSWPKFASHYTGGTDKVSECKMDVRFAWNPRWHQMDYVSWSLGLFTKNHLLEVGLTQNRKTIALWNFTIVDLLYYIWGPFTNRISLKYTDSQNGVSESLHQFSHTMPCK